MQKTFFLVALLLSASGWCLAQCDHTLSLSIDKIIFPDHPDRNADVTLEDFMITRDSLFMKMVAPDGIQSFTVEALLHKDSCTLNEDYSSGYYAFWIELTDEDKGSAIMHFELESVNSRMKLICRIDNQEDEDAELQIKSWKLL